MDDFNHEEPSVLTRSSLNKSPLPLFPKERCKRFCKILPEKKRDEGDLVCLWAAFDHDFGKPVDQTRGIFAVQALIGKSVIGAGNHM